MVQIAGAAAYDNRALVVADILKKGSYEQSVRLCEENSKKIEEKFTEKMKQNNVRTVHPVQYIVLRATRKLNFR